MKKLLFILSILLFTLVVNAQTQTEDEVYIGKGKTFGIYNGNVDQSSSLSVYQSLAYNGICLMYRAGTAERD